MTTVDHAAQLKAWYNGTATGGTNGDGRYPLTDSSGTTHLVLCPAAETSSDYEDSLSADTGVTAGAYGSTSLTAGTAPSSSYFTVDAWGRLTKAGSLTLGTAASYGTGVSGTVVPLLSGANTWSAKQTFASFTDSTTYLGSTLGKLAVVSAITDVTSKPIGSARMYNTSGSTAGILPTDSGYWYVFTLSKRDGSANSGSFLATQYLGNATYVGYTDGTGTALTWVKIPGINVSNAWTGANTFAGQVSPATSATYALGTSSLLWSQVYASNTTISSSDARLKTEPRDMTDAELSAFSAIARLPMVWRWLKRVDEEGNDARLHSGPTVQAAIALMTANDLDWTCYSAFCYDKWEAETEPVMAWRGVTDADGNTSQEEYDTGETKTLVEAGDRYSFRKEELIWWCMRALFAEHDNLKARLEALEASTKSST